MKSFLLFFLLILALTACTGQNQTEAVNQSFTLRTGMADGRMAYIGVGGAIDGLINPDLTVKTGERVRIEMQNGDGVSHDLALPDLARRTPPVMGKEKGVSLIFTPAAAGVYTYICTVSGHRQAGMEGRLVVTP